MVDISGKGKGVVPLNEIRKGEFVCEYNGECISYKEAASCENDYLGVQTNYKGYMFFFKFKDRHLW